MKKLLFILLAIVSLICLSVFCTSAYDGTQYGSTGIYYQIFDNKVSIVDAKSSIVTANIPSAINGYPVTNISWNAFEYCTELTSVTIPSSVKSIGEWAFEGCTGLKSIKIPNSVTSIGDGAFSDCKKLTSVTISSSVKSIGEWAFSDCTGLKSIIIPNSVTSIGKGAFCDCKKLTSVTIPSSVKSIGELAFYDCIGLTSITIPNSVKSIGEWAFERCTGLKSIKIPNSVTSIGEGAFSECKKLASITIPNSIKSIGEWAFQECSSLTKVNITDIAAWCKIKFHGSNPLAWAENLYLNNKLITNLVIPNSVKSIGSDAFYGCTGLKSIKISNSVTSIGGYAFGGCTGLTSITIPNSVISIGEGAFSDCTGLKSIKIPNSVTSIGDYAFYDCTGLTSVTIPSSVKSIGELAFCDCKKLSSVTIPSSVKSIGECAFDNTGYYNNSSNWYDGLLYIDNHLIDAKNNIKSVSFKPGTLTIADSALSYTNLTSIIIPNTVKNIGKCAFSGCEKLTSITVDRNNTVYDSRDNCNAIIKTDTNELVFGYEYTDIPNTVKSIGDFAFEHCTGLTSITIPSNVKSIGVNAFRYTGLKSIKIPNSITNIGEDAFSCCKNLASIIIPNSVKKIGNGAFSCCENLTSIKISNNVTSICESTFLGCENLISITIPDSVNSIGNDAFNGCTGLTKITIPKSVTKIGEGTFSWCENLTSIKISNGVTSIGKEAFRGCSDLTSITIPSSVKSIGENAFDDCAGLKSITIENKSLSICGGALIPDSTKIICPCDSSALKDAKVYGYNYSIKGGHTFNNSIVKATLSKEGVNRQTCSKCNAKQTVTIACPKTFTISNQAYTGKALKPAITVKDTKGNVIDAKYYTVTYSNNTKMGTATAKITFKTNYSGSKSVTFKIVPAQVKNLKQTKVSATTFTLSWSKVTGAKYYRIEWSKDGKTWNNNLDLVTTNTATVKPFKEGTKYQFRVTALDSTKKIAGKVSAVLKTGTLTAAPTIKLTSTKKATATVTITKVTGATKYTVYKSTDNKKWTKVGDTTKLTYDLTKLSAGKKIYVKVVAVNAYGKASAYSKVASVTVKK